MTRTVTSLTVIRFVTVGAAGLVVQIVALAALISLADWPWLPATVAAVELAVVHNYLWHERWTWKDRCMSAAHRARASRFVRFNIANGLASIVGNVALMWLLVDGFAVPPVVANLIAVTVISIANFVAADRWVFRLVSASFIVCATVAAPPIEAATAAPNRTALDAWDRYIAQTERQWEHSRVALHVTSNGAAAEGNSIAVPAGTISHWRGAVFIRGVTLDRLLDGLMNPGTPPPQEDVVASRVLARRSNSLRVYIRMVRRAIVTVTYDTEHEMTFSRPSPTMAIARSVATRIDEEGGVDHGFLWRLHSYWRYEQQPGGVRVELDSVTLSRAVPSFARTVASPLVNRVARESIYRTLEALRRNFAAT